jgi:thioredoxin reductase (NADPH)
MRRRSHGCHEQTRLPLTASKENSVSESGRRSNTAYTNVGTIIIITSLIVFGVIILTKLCSSEPPVQLLGSRQKYRLLQHHEGALYRQRESQPIKHLNLIHLQSSRRQFDVIIVGCGPAGITAAMFAARMGMSVLVVGSPSAGSLSGTDRIDNYPSFFGSTNDGGQGWIDASLEQAAYFGAQFAPPTFLATRLVKTALEQHTNTAIEVHLQSESITTSSPDSKVIGKAAIIATGSIPRKLNLAHESTLRGHALHNCALCDGDNYVTRGGAKKHVAVIGGGDAAVEAIFLLHKIGVDTIHWIHRRESYRATSSDVEKIRQLTNVEIWAPYVVVEWILKGRENIAREGNLAHRALGGIRVVAAKNGQSDLEATSSITIPCDGAFLMIGSTPNTHWLASSGIDIDSTSKLLIRQSSVLDGSLLRDSTNDVRSGQVFSTATSMEGVFAAGEVVDDIYRQALTASSEGAKAAIDVQRYLRIKFDDTISKSNNLAIEDRNKGSERAPALVKRNDVNCDLTTSECIKFVVSSHPVVVFSKSYCPFCRRALEVLRSYSDRSNFIEPLVLDLTEIEDPSVKEKGGRIQDTLEVMTGRRTVPNVFVGGFSIGGGDETTALHLSGKLSGTLQTAGAFD